MILGDLRACDGPPCPRDGCRDSQIIEPATGGSFGHGLALCNYCGRQFRFAAPTEGTAASTGQVPAAHVGSELAAERRRRRWSGRPRL